MVRWPAWFPFADRGPRIVPIAEFSTPALADEAWERLAEAGIPAAVVTDPAMLGGVSVLRVEVEEPFVDAAQRIVADLVG